MSKTQKSPRTPTPEEQALINQMLTLFVENGNSTDLNLMLEDGFAPDGTIDLIRIAADTLPSSIERSAVLSVLLSNGLQ